MSDKVCRMDCFHCPFGDCISDAPATKKETEMLRAAWETKEEAARLEAERDRRHKAARERLRAKYRREGRCIACGTQDARTLVGRVLCEACAARNAAAARAKRAAACARRAAKKEAGA